MRKQDKSGTVNWRCFIFGPINGSIKGIGGRESVGQRLFRQSLKRIPAKDEDGSSGSEHWILW